MNRSTTQWEVQANMARITICAASAVLMLLICVPRVFA